MADKLGPFYGINNRKDAYDLGVVGDRGRKGGDFLRNAVNVDLTLGGNIRRRKGVDLLIAGTDTHSLWADGTKAFYIDGTNLCALNVNMLKTVIKSNLTPGNRASFAKVIDDVYWSNGIVIERITSGVSTPAGIPVPNPLPVATESSGGALHAGAYQITITSIAPDGEESGAMWPVQLEVAENSIITLSGIPITEYDTKVYMSALNGDMLFAIARLPAGTTSYNVSVMPQLGHQITTLGLTQMPPGQVVRQFNGRLLVANSNTLFVSEPYAHALHNPMKGRIPFPERITIVEPCDNGVYVVADQTYWISGADIMKSEAVPVLPYGAVEGTGSRIEESKNVWWFSLSGIVVGDPSGAVNNIQEKNVAVDPAKIGASLYRVQDGIQQMMTSMFGSEVSNAAASSYMQAEVIRKGSML